MKHTANLLSLLLPAGALALGAVAACAEHQVTPRTSVEAVQAACRMLPPNSPPEAREACAVVLAVDASAIPDPK